MVELRGPFASAQGRLEPMACHAKLPKGSKVWWTLYRKVGTSSRTSFFHGTKCSSPATPGWEWRFHPELSAIFPLTGWE